MTDLLRDQLQTSLGAAFTLERELGGGGMSRVFVARDEALGRAVVVKVLPPEMAGAMSVERFRREIQVAARLQHPHVVPLLSAGHDGELLWFTMPYVAGESLRTRLVRGELPVVEAVRVLREVADALAYAHAERVVHRDIKPENVLLSQGHALVTDFGVAKALSTATGAAGGTSIGMAVGTPAYMAPEQAAADPSADHRVDVYAFGVLAYELLVGEPPFRGRTAQEVVAAHMTQAPEPLARRRPNVPEALAALVMRCLEKRPADRPQGAAELVHVLDAALTPGGHVPGHASFDAAASSRRSGRGPWRWALAGAVALTGVAGAAVWRARPPAIAVDERLVAVLPFRVAGADPSLRYLREGMIDLLAAKLTGTTRVAEPRSVLAAWRAAGGSETADVEPERATRLAARLGAHDVLFGDVTGGRPTVVLRASLVPVAGGDARTATVEGAQDSLSILVDRLAAQLLALRAGESARALGGLAGTPLPAIRAFLEGQVLSRRGVYDEAMAGYLAAVRADSNFAAAWYGVLEMDGWLGRGLTDTASAALVRLRDRLPPATRALVDARIGPRWPRQPTLAETRRLAERATQVAPESPAAWEYLGEVLYHWAANEGVADARARATAAFERSIALDSTYTIALEHLPELYYEQGDSARVRQALAARLARDSTSTTALFHLIFADAVLGDRRRGAAWREHLRTSTDGLGDAILFATELGLPLHSLDSAASAIAARAVTDAERRRLAGAVARLALARGQPERAARMTRERLGVDGVAEGAVLDQVFGDGDSTLAADARRALERRLASDSVGRYRSAWFAAGLYDLSRGDRETARRAVARLRAIPPGACTVDTPTVCADYARVLDAQLAADERRADAPARLAELDSLLKEGPVRNGPLLQEGNLVAARLWERAGDPARALAAARRRTHFYGAQPLMATFLREEGRLAAATGDRDGAVRAYRKYLALRDEAEPALRPHLESVRRELGRLEREQAGR